MLGAVVGVQFLLMGMLAEMQMRTYHEAQDKRPYVVSETIDRSPAPRAEESG
jgi:hypothetical protein